MIFRFSTVSTQICIKNKQHRINYLAGIIYQIIEKSIKLNFEKYISNICKTASNQLKCNLHADCKHFMDHKEKEAMINTFVHSKRSSDKYFFCAFKFQLWPCLVFGTSVVNKTSPKL